MLKLLQEISKRALLLNEYEFTEEQMQTKWLGCEPASDQEIENVQVALQIDLPKDYVDFLKLTNGFPSCTSSGVTFLPVSQVDYLINVDEDLVEIWNSHDELAEVARALSESLLIGGLNEEQYFLLIPPNNRIKKWRYWKFASWIPGEHEFKNLKDYLKSELAFLKEETKGLRKPKSKSVDDYSLRESVFDLDWESTYRIAYSYLREDKLYSYFHGHVELLRLLLYATSKLSSFHQLEKDLAALKSDISDEWLKDFISKVEELARHRMNYMEPFHTSAFVPRDGMDTLEQIEEQTRVWRPDLLKPGKELDKADYQLYFLFADGSATAFIDMYESNTESNNFNSHLKAALVYGTLNQVEEAQKAIERYFKKAFGYRPLEPFLYDVLTGALTKDFCKKILEKCS